MTALQRYRKVREIQACLVECPDDVPEELSRFVMTGHTEAQVATNEGGVSVQYPFWLAADAEDPDHAWPIGPDTFEDFYAPAEEQRPIDRLESVTEELLDLVDEADLVDDAVDAIYRAVSYLDRARNGPPAGPADHVEPPQPFAIVRPEGYEGMSGGGRVAEGLELPSGQCVYWWLTGPHSIQVMPSLDDVEHIHTHGGADGTEIIHVDELTVERECSP